MFNVLSKMEFKQMNKEICKTKWRILFPHKFSVIDGELSPIARSADARILGGFECERHISVLSALSLNLNSVHGLSLHTFLLQYLARDCHGEFSAGKQIKSFAAASLCNASTLIWGCSNDACGSGGMEPSANSLFETLLITISAGALMYYHNWRTHQTTTGWKGS